MSVACYVLIFPNIGGDEVDRDVGETPRICIGICRMDLDHNSQAILSRMGHEVCDDTGTAKSSKSSLTL